jgi:hypothetical protein
MSPQKVYGNQVGGDLKEELLRVFWKKGGLNLGQLGVFQLSQNQFNSAKRHQQLLLFILNHPPTFSSVLNFPCKKE